MGVEFDDTNISLDIPLSNGIDVNEWKILPLVTPKVSFVLIRCITIKFFVLQLSKKRVDSFKPGRKVPSTKLVATLSESSWDCKVPRRSHLTTLKGAKEPDNQMRIVLDPVDPNQGIVSMVFV